jgi:hypothetical protein
MTALRVVHAGYSAFYRAKVLRSAGYAVQECETIEELAAWFREGHQADLVCISEEPRCAAEGMIALARAYSIAAVVLFRATDHPRLQRGVDLDYPPLTPPEEWLKDLARFFAKAPSVERQETLPARLRQRDTVATGKTERQSGK